MRKQLFSAALALLLLFGPSAGAAEAVLDPSGGAQTEAAEPTRRPSSGTQREDASEGEALAGNGQDSPAAGQGGESPAESAPLRSTGTVDLSEVSHSTSNVAVDGFQVAPEGYCIRQENYYKLRDLAFLLAGKRAAFDVVWDDENQCISMVTGRDYTVAGGEMARSGSAEIYKFVPSYSEIRLNGQVVQMTGYNINNNNYYRIRDVGPLVGFGVDWDNDTSTVVISGGSEETTAPPETLPSSGSGTESTGPAGTDPGLPAEPSNPGGTGAEASNPPGTAIDPNTGAVIDPETGEEIPQWVGPKIDGVLTILLDPGHGGTDGGSDNPTTGQNENTTNLAVAQYLKNMLEADGVRVIMSRDSTSTTLRGTDRKEYVRSVCEQGELDLVLSIHHNGSTAHTARGSEVYVQAAGLSPYAGSEGREDSSKVSKALGSSILTSYMHLGKGLTNRGVKETSTLYMVYVAGEYGIPAVLSEYCFIDNASDIKLINTPEGLQAEAKAIYDAVTTFYASTPY